MHLVSMHITLPKQCSTGKWNHKRSCCTEIHVIFQRVTGTLSYCFNGLGCPWIFCREPGLRFSFRGSVSCPRSGRWITESCWASSADRHVRWAVLSGGWSELNRLVRTLRVFYCADTAGDRSSTDAALTLGQTYQDEWEQREVCKSHFWGLLSSVLNYSLFIFKNMIFISVYTHFTVT